MVLATASVHLLCGQVPCAACCFLLSLDALLPRWPPEVQVRLLWQTWVYPESEWAEPFLQSWVEACSLLLGMLGRSTVATLLCSCTVEVGQWWDSLSLSLVLKRAHPAKQLNTVPSQNETFHHPPGLTLTQKWFNPPQGHACDSMRKQCDHIVG